MYFLNVKANLKTPFGLAWLSNSFCMWRNFIIQSLNQNKNKKYFAILNYTIGSHLCWYFCKINITKLRVFINREFSYFRKIYYFLLQSNTFFILPKAYRSHCIFQSKKVCMLKKWGKICCKTACLNRYFRFIVIIGLLKNAQIYTCKTIKISENVFNRTWLRNTRNFSIPFEKGF